VPGDGERERLRQTFDQVAECYDRARPEYPEILFADLVALTGIKPGDQLLEVAAGPTVRRDPPPPGAASRPVGAAGLGRGAARRAAPRAPLTRTAGPAGGGTVSVGHYPGRGL